MIGWLGDGGESTTRCSPCVITVSAARRTATALYLMLMRRLLRWRE